MAEFKMLRHPATLTGAIAMLAALATVHGLGVRLPAGLWWQAAFAPDLADTRQLLVQYSFLPRLAVSLLCGAALALAGTMFQQVMRNPLAAPTTLGVSAGAGLGLTVATLFLPALLEYGRDAITLGGAVLAGLCVFGLAWRRALSPLTLVLAGLIVSLYCGAVAAGLQLLYDPYALSIFLWGSGALGQQNWDIVLALLLRFALLIPLIALVSRPLGLLELDDTGARSLGLSPFGARLAALALATVLAASVASAVGVISFIDLAAPALVRLSGARRLRDRLLWAPLLGAGLLCLTDQLVQWAFAGDQEWVPTGTATALLGAPLLLWMIPQMRSRGEPPPRATLENAARARRPWRLVRLLLLGLLVLAILSLCFGRGLEGWHWSTIEELSPLLPWRLPRLIGAVSAGAMLATAGVLLQRLTGNSMASPEILGIGTGAALSLIALVALVPATTEAMQVTAALLGASATLGGILLLGRRSAYAPDRILLAGIAMSALFQVLVAVFMVSGNPQAAALRNWMAGSTDLTTPNQAGFAMVTAVLLLALAPLTARWLRILPLGPSVSQALGLNLDGSRAAILLLAAVLSAAATLAIGPLGFVGLMGPHLARLLGLRQPLTELVGAALLGALVMLIADWLGRTLLFPYQLPAGLLAALIGGPYLMWLLQRRQA